MTACLAAAQTAKLTGDLNVTGKVNCADLSTDSLYASKDLEVEGDISLTSMTAERLNTQQITASTLGASGGVLRIQGDVVISRTSTVASASYLQLQTWVEVSEDDFDTGLNGWTDIGRSTCGLGNWFLGGYCNASSQETRKTFTLPPHRSVRVTANYHMLDRWEGETGYLKAGDEYIWTLAGDISHGKGVDVCGGPEVDTRLGAVIDVVFTHSSKHLELSFGATLQGDPCTASYGIDEVMVYIQ